MIPQFSGALVNVPLPGGGSTTAVPGLGLGFAAGLSSADGGSPYARSLYAGGADYAGCGAGSGYSPYSSYADPYGGGLCGAADVIRAQGTFEKDFRQARLLNQEVERSKADARRKIYDWLYERANTPSIADIQEKEQKLENRRALLRMPLSEVPSAYALNTLLDDLKKGNLNAKDPYGPIDPDTLKQINVTSQSSAGNVGVLKPVKDGGTLAWPLPL